MLFCWMFFYESLRVSHIYGMNLGRNDLPIILFLIWDSSESVTNTYSTSIVLNTCYIERELEERVVSDDEGT